MKNGSEPPLDDYQKLVFGRLRHFGKVVVEAAPGTGKTFTGISLAVNAAREQWISNERPSLFLTFSKNARVQIENELRHYEGQGWLAQGEKAAIRISNYHAFFFELLRKRGGIWGLKKDFRPCTLTYRKERIKGIFKKSKLNYADYKESLCSALCWNESEISLPREIVPVYKELAIADIKNQQPHYNEFAPLVYYLLESCSELRKWLMIKYPLLILDEFQDSDCCQWKILKVWNPLKAAIFYDSYQMIYGWRKANPDRIQEVIDWWNIPAESQIELKTLHRAGSQRTLANVIVDLRADKLMGSHVFIGNKRWLTLISCSNRTRREVKPQEQARDRIRWGQMIVSGETTGIICKANDMVSYLHQQLRKKPSSRSGPYFACKRVESESTDERLRDYLHQLENITSEYELRGWIGSLLNILLPVSQKDYISKFAGSARNLPQNRDTEGPKSRVKSLLLPFWDKVAVTNIQSFLKALSLLPEIARILSEEIGHPDYEAIVYIRNMAKASTMLPSNVSWDELLLKLDNSVLKTSYLSLKRKPKGIFILTTHQSKGREFDHVIIPWLSSKDEYVYASNPAVSNIQQYSYYNYDEEEDRRLLYVAFTRAKKRITIIYPENTPSVFLTKWKLLAS